MARPECPACDRVLHELGASEHVCARCLGRFLEPGLAQLELERHVGLSRAELHELSGAFGGVRARCPGCAREMSPLVLRGTSLGLCFGCGALWLERGALARLTDDPDRELEAEGLPPLADEDEDEDEDETDPGVAQSVVLAAERAPTLEALVRAFIAAGRTRFDAERYQRSQSSVLLDKVDAETAGDFRGALGDEADRVAVIDAALLEVPLIFDPPRVTLQDDALYAIDHLGASRAFPYEDIVAVAAGFMPGAARKSGFAQKRQFLIRGPAAHRLEHEVKRGRSDVYILGLIAGDTRVRLSSDRLASIPGRERAATLRAMTESLAERRAVAVHPHTRAALAAGAEVPRVHSLGELDRELAWAAWRTRVAEGALGPR